MCHMSRSAKLFLLPHLTEGKREDESLKAARAEGEHAPPPESTDATGHRSRDISQPLGRGAAPEMR